jgi:hypothetical protein
VKPGTGEKQQSSIKLALAAGLTVVFIVVVAIQVKTYSGDGTSSTHEPGVTAQAEQNDEATVGQAESSVDDKPVVQWPAVDLDECIAYDPFAAPAALDSKEREQVNLHDAGGLAVESWSLQDRGPHEPKPSPT